MTATRLEALREALSERGLDGLLVSQPASRRYISGFTGSAGLLLILPDEAILATDSRYTAQARSQAPGFRVVEATGDLARWLPPLLEGKARALGFESEHLTVASYRDLLKARRKLPPDLRPRLVPVRGLVEGLRARKTAAELEAIRRAAALADAAVAHLERSLRPGMSEREAAWTVERFLRENGSEELPFPIIVASGPNAALPHAEPSDRVIGEGEPVVVDLGARVGGYASDLTRTLCLGTPDGTFIRVYRAVEHAQRRALEHLRPGMKGGEADALAREVIRRAGYGQAFRHGLGHGVGLEVHEPPRLGPRSRDALEEGMVFTLEPGIYLEGWGGVRIEDMVSLGEKGASLITRARRITL